MKNRSTRLARRALFLVALCAGVASAHDESTPIAYEGGPAAGLPAGVTHTFLSVPVLARDGGLIFLAQVTGNGVGVGNDTLSYVGTPDVMNILQREGDPAAGTLTNLTGLAFDFGLRSGGFAATRGQVSGGTAANDGCLWFGGPGALALVGREGGPAWTTGSTYPNDLFWPDIQMGFPCVNDLGTTALRTLILGGGVTGANDEALFVGPPGALAPVAREGAPAPGAPGANFTSIAGITFGVPVVNTGGAVAFVGGLGGTGVTPVNQQGIWTGPPGGVALGARGGDLVPALGTGRALRVFTSVVDLNAAGQIFFQNITYDTAGNAPLTALLLGNPGGLAKVALQLDPMPQDSEGLNFGSAFTNLRLTDSGRVAFLALSLNSQLVSRTSLYAGLPGGLKLLAKNGDPAAGFTGDIVYGPPQDVFLGGDGSVAFKGAIQGTGVTPNVNDACLWKADPAANVSVLARTGDSLFVGGVKRTFAGFALYAGSNAGSAAAGRSGAIDDSGNVAFLATFTDGTHAVFVVSSRIGSLVPGGGGGGGGSACDSLQSCHAELTAALPDPLAASSKKARQFAKQIARLDRKLGRYIAKALAAGNAKRAAKFFRKTGKAVLKIRTKAAKAQSKAALDADIAVIDAAGAALSGLLPQ